MKTASEKIQQYHSLKPFQFDCVSRLELTVSPLVQGYCNHLLIDLTASCESGSTQVLALSFEGVRDLQLRVPGVPFQTYLEIRDVSDQQWDRVNYKIVDFENGRLSFLCHDFSFQVQDATT